MEQTAIDQLNKTAALPGVIRTVGLPDLHAGKIPVGIALETQGILYPHLIGGDIGCGMSLFQTGCALRRYKADRFVTRLNYIRALEELPLTQALPDCPLAAPGTIGGGNHFAEFQRVEEVRDPEAFRQPDLSAETGGGHLSFCMVPFPWRGTQMGPFPLPLPHRGKIRPGHHPPHPAGQPGGLP